MHEATRRQYLALLGIEQWLPRDAVDAVDAAAVDIAVVAVAGPAVAEMPTDYSAEAGPAGMAAAAVPLPAERAAQIDEMLAQSRRPSVAPPRATEPAVAAAVAAAQTHAGPAAPESALPVSDRIGCSVLPLDDGLLIIAAFVAPQAPGLSGPEHALLANIAAALVPGAMLPATLDFSWPPPRMRVPGMEKPGVGREALVAMISEQRKRGARDVIVLGNDLVVLLGDALTRLTLTQASGPSLAMMLADPQAKRACWEAVRSLRRARL